jgi:hypothetical protein
MFSIEPLTVAACNQAKHDRWDYIWIDTCCIDKSSSSELSEAINSMFQWYQNAGICYAYLQDVNIDSDLLGVNQDETLMPVLARARWFKRGWTLQELIAAKEVMFYSSDWKCFGNKTYLSTLIFEITGIDKNVLMDPNFLSTVSIARRFAWSSNRETTRPEDSSYCLMGIFGVNMPLLYGEGEKAFVRLQEEIMKDSEDESIFAWDLPPQHERSTAEPMGLLAPSSKCFSRSQNILAYESHFEPYTITNRGIRIQIPMLNIDNVHRHICILQCRYKNSLSDSIGLPLLTMNTSSEKYFRDVSRPMITISASQAKSAEVSTIYIQNAGINVSQLLPTPYCHLRKYPKVAGIDFMEAIAFSASPKGRTALEPGYEPNEYTHWNMEERTMVVDAHPFGYFAALRFSVKTMNPEIFQKEKGAAFVAILKLPRSGNGLVGLVPLMETNVDKLLTLTEALHFGYHTARAVAAELDIYNGVVKAKIHEKRYMARRSLSWTSKAV